MKQNHIEIQRLNGLIELAKLKQLDVWVIGGNHQQIKSTWKTWGKHVELKGIEPVVITNHVTALDGESPHNAVIILIDRWWENKHATELLRSYIPLAYLCRHISDIAVSNC